LKKSENLFRPPQDKEAALFELERVLSEDLQQVEKRERGRRAWRDLDTTLVDFSGH
jgi:hypothetical protein